MIGSLAKSVTVAKKPIVSNMPLVDFLMQLENCAPAIPDAMTDY